MRVLSLIQDLKQNHGVDVQTIRCDNAGENKDTETHLRQSGFPIRFEYTSSNTPQHNGVVERRFATLYGRVRAMQHFCRCNQDLKLRTWAKCANTASDLWNIQVQANETRCPHQLFYGNMPRYAYNLQIFGQAGIVLRPGKKTIKGKLTSRGDKKYFVGYARDHSHDVYRMYNPETGRVSITRDIRWLDTLIGDDYNDGLASISG